MRRSVVGPPSLVGARAAALVAASALLLLTTGCATSRPSDAGGTASELITSDEIASSHATTAYDAVAKLRRNFLSNRGKTSLLDSTAPVYPNVYVDGVPYGPIESLHNIAASDVMTIRLYRAWEATTKYGTGNPAGVIEVTTKRR